MASDFEDEIGEEAPRGSYDLKEIVIFGVARFRGSVIALGLVGLLVGVCYALSKPNEYLSMGKIQVLLGEREQRGTEEAVDEDLDTRRQIVGIADEIEILDNPELHRRVAERVGVERILDVYDPTQGDGPQAPIWQRWLHSTQAWWFRRGSPLNSEVFDPTSEDAILAAAQAAKGNALIYGSSHSNFVYITYTSHSRQLAKDAVDAYLAEAIPWHRQVYEREYIQTFIAQLTETAREQVDEALKELEDHRDECLIYDIDKQKDNQVQRGHKLEVDYSETSMRLQGIAGELTLVVEELEKAAPTVEVELGPEVITSFEFLDVSKRLENAHEELRVLEGTVSSSSDHYKGEKARLTQLLASLNLELREISKQTELRESVTSTIINPRLEKLETLIADLQQERARLTVKLDLLGKALIESHERLGAISACERHHQLLKDNIDSLRAEANALNEKLAEQEVMARIDSEERMSNLNIVQAGVLPTSKQGPFRGGFVLMGLFGGICVGIALAILRQFLDQRLRYPGGLERFLGVPVLGVVPEDRLWRIAGRRIREEARREL